MRKIKASNSYLKNQTRKNLAKAALWVLIFVAGLSAIMFRMIWNLKIDTIDLLGVGFLFLPVVAAYYYIRKYHLYSGGWKGEKMVSSTLNHTLNDDYYLVNDLYLKEGGGDIDHVVLAPNGVFVLETKNWSGSITVNGDEWRRGGRRNSNISPSSQVKRNVTKVRRIIENSPELRALGVWVEGIVVLTNKHAVVRFNSATVPILKLSQLTTYIQTHGGQRRFTSQQLEQIGKEIAKQKA